MRHQNYAFFLAGALLFINVPLMTGALAKRYTPDQCNGLRQLRHEMESQGVGRMVAKGAKWGGTNLDAAQLSEVGAFLKLGEEIRFRCGKSTIGKKRQSALNVNIPLPVRNSRRLKKEQAAKAKRSDSALAAPVKVEGGSSVEEKSVISAVTGETEKSAPSKSVETSDKPAQK